MYLIYIIWGIGGWGGGQIYYQVYFKALTFKTQAQTYT